jgi:ferredoxin
MKYPLITENWKSDVRTLRVEYITRITELILDASKCTACRQCSKACPKEAIEMPKIIPGAKLTKMERLPTFPQPNKCVFCGACMWSCPYGAIGMKLDGQPLGIADLELVKRGVLPELTAMKVGKPELKNPDFKSNFFTKMLDRIEIKRIAK